MEKLTLNCIYDSRDSISFKVRGNELDINSRENTSEALEIILNISNVKELKKFFEKALELMKSEE